MTERVRSMMKSASTRGSMAHMGTTPCKYQVDFVVSHVDHIKTADEVCLVWDRRGKSVNTRLAKVVNKKAMFRETLTMETTLFRRAAPGIKMGEPPRQGEECKFDEKKAKFALRKGGPNGKALGKIQLNIADYIKAVSGSVFVDLKLSNGSVASVKIISTFLHVGKKEDKKEEDGPGSDAESVLSEAPDGGGMDTDSIFGDDASSNASLVIEVERVEENADGTKKRVPVRSSDPKSPMSELSLSPVSTDGGKTPTKMSKGESKRGLSKRISTAALKESTSTRSRHRKRDRGEKDELRKEVEKLKAENSKLKASKKAAVEEIDALRDELRSAEELEAVSSSPSSVDAMKRKTVEEMKSLRKQIKELKAQNLALVEELEELNTELQEKGTGAAGEEVAELKDQVKQLEIALRREPKFMDVVNELKVAKVSLALANMEKEQAQFALFQFKGRSPR